MVSERRLAHITRVSAMLDRWADEMKLGAEQAQAWHDAGRWHDALRDAPDDRLRSLADEPDRPVEMLHGHAAAVMLERDGERRADVLDAVRWHTTGSATWNDVGRALYMADFLEPGRKFSRDARAFLAARVPQDFHGAFRQVLRIRLEWSLREGKMLFEETVQMWNAVR